MKEASLVNPNMLSELFGVERVGRERRLIIGIVVEEFEASKRL